MTRKLILLCIAVVAVSVRGATFNTTNGFAIDLPGSWLPVPTDVLDAFAERTGNLSSNAPVQYYDCGYQAVSTNGQWLSFPYVLIQVRPVGRIPSSELARYQTLSEKMEEFALPDVSIGDTVYDKGSQILWTTLATHTEDGLPVKALVAVKLTELGYIRLMGCSTEDTFEEYEKIFRNSFSTLGIDESIAYKPQIADAVPPVGGIKTGMVLVWIVQAVVIGGVLWVVYLLIKRTVRKAKD